MKFSAVSVTKKQAFRLWAVLLAACLTHLVVSLAVAEAFTVRADTTRSGKRGNGSASSPALSKSGSLVAFTSTASNLVRRDTNRKSDIFIKNLTTRSVRRVSQTDAGKQANGRSYSPALSGDGKFVAFVSEASNLVRGDTNRVSDVFVQELETGDIQRASQSAGGGQGDQPSGNPDTYLSLSNDGRFVAFTSEASTLVAGDSNQTADVFVKDLQTGAVQRASESAFGEQGNGSSGDLYGSPVLSGDGSLIVFASDASNLVPDDTNEQTDIFVKDLAGTGFIGRASTTAAGEQAAGFSGNPSGRSAFSSNGLLIAFASSASNMVSINGGPWAGGLFIKGVNTGQLQLVSGLVASTGASVVLRDDPFGAPAFSGDGKFIVFDSAVPNLVPSDINGLRDVFIQDITSISIRKISRYQEERIRGKRRFWFGSQPAISGNGERIAYVARLSISGESVSRYRGLFVVDNPLS